MNAFRSLVVLGLVLALVSGLAGCAGKKAVPVTPVPTPDAEKARMARIADSLAAVAKQKAEAEAAAAAAAAAAEAKRKAEEEALKAALTDIHFEYDKSRLTSEAQAIMGENAKTMAGKQKVKILIEGHCDERGTAEYNLALGERRASSAKKFLVDYGIDPDRIQTISYGKERPIALGHDESAWAQNRRAHFVKVE